MPPEFFVAIPPGIRERVLAASPLEAARAVARRHFPDEDGLEVTGRGSGPFPMRSRRGFLGWVSVATSEAKLESVGV